MMLEHVYCKECGEDILAQVWTEEWERRMCQECIDVVDQREYGTILINGFPIRVWWNKKEKDSGE
ncbi:hypothetical protein B7C51_08515 [Paenibacillus larvae subsp. pulvifaciens]|uniref:Uncharacterized protein n=1 Tax=Paenibacillus larvae subsp. pulvifaciens TaxID=1477 RepID=A0A1V0URG3_9BACL|nr:hypothetical protein [Paenibacillus larvae]ARF67863.1 hypothetical protein B7C51_08515 [Paenibacillus larvae subsp. pulvifaciens]